MMVLSSSSKAQAVTDDNKGFDVNPQVKTKRGGQVTKGVQNVEPSYELMEIPARVTRASSFLCLDRFSIFFYL